MDKLLLLLLLLGLLPFEFFQGVDFQCTILHCIIHNSHRKNGKCMEGNGNCTVEEGPGCRTRDLYFFNERDGWRYNHTELDCSNLCKAWKLFHAGLKVSSFCCKGQDFCNRYRGKSLQWKSH